jgi:hypothetical protein
MVWFRQGWIAGVVIYYCPSKIIGVLVTLLSNSFALSSQEATPRQQNMLNGTHLLPCSPVALLSSRLFLLSLPATMESSDFQGRFRRLRGPRRARRAPPRRRVRPTTMCRALQNCGCLQLQSFPSRYSRHKKYTKICIPT